MTKEQLLARGDNVQKKLEELEDVKETLKRQQMTIPLGIVKRIEALKTAKLRWTTRLNRKIQEEASSAQQMYTNRGILSVCKTAGKLPPANFHLVYEETHEAEPYRKDLYDQLFNASTIHEHVVLPVMKNVSDEETSFHRTLTQLAFPANRTEEWLDTMHAAALSKFVLLHRRNRCMPIIFVKFCVWCAEEFARVKIHWDTQHYSLVKQIRKLFATTREYDKKISKLWSGAGEFGTKLSQYSGRLRASDNKIQEIIDDYVRLQERLEEIENNLVHLTTEEEDK